MDWTECDIVERVPGKLSGKPILKHTRVTADAVLESYELGETIDEIAYSFTLDPEDVRRVLAFATNHAVLSKSA